MSDARDEGNGRAVAGAPMGPVAGAATDSARGSMPGAPSAEAPDATTRAASDGPLSIRRFVVKPDRVCCLVHVSDERFVDTSLALVARALKAYPHLLEHACVNDKGDTFAAVAAHTSVPHLIEHMVIEEQVRLEPPDALPRVYTGKTAWDDRRSRIARIEVSFADDLVALRAFNHAVGFVNAALRDA